MEPSAICGTTVASSVGEAVPLQARSSPARAGDELSVSGSDLFDGVPATTAAAFTGGGDRATVAGGLAAACPFDVALGRTGVGSSRAAAAAVRFRRVSFLLASSAVDARPFAGSPHFFENPAMRSFRFSISWTAAMAAEFPVSPASSRTVKWYRIFCNDGPDSINCWMDVIRTDASRSSSCNSLLAISVCATLKLARAKSCSI